MVDCFDFPACAAGFPASAGTVGLYEEVRVALDVLVEVGVCVGVLVDLVVEYMVAYVVGFSVVFSGAHLMGSLLKRTWLFRFLTH